MPVSKTWQSAWGCYVEIINKYGENLGYASSVGLSSAAPNKTLHIWPVIDETEEHYGNVHFAWDSGSGDVEPAAVRRIHHSKRAQKQPCPESPCGKEC